MPFPEVALVRAAPWRTPRCCRPSLGSGYYIGGFGGGAWSDRDPIFTDLGNAQFRAFSGGLTAGRVEDVHSWGVPVDNSVIAGGTLGCNWQFAGSPFVFGINRKARC